MITAVDTNVLLDILRGDERHGPESRERLKAAYDAGAVVVCDIVYAELVPAFDDRSGLDDTLRRVNASLSPITTDIAYEAGLRWQRYRRAGGPRERIITDFLIGAHALAGADTFLTRDRGFYATYFPELGSDGALD
ncbi:MAG: type II toxin-antitoxin system VapC family toxin [Acidimicrobiaceae bacterium]|nr:type II toxin-antitoxin system VapC family toxin [Acidimicrobiaceae bacterium]MYE95846.1 type II toxin-antitoxin system VapC family toxin [Acidimicrobiaceae bacterium]MYI52625.1 type II toxin-antitoxin system VapC family toxin [Acidimicrobiaceae bacterium]